MRTTLFLLLLLAACSMKLPAAAVTLPVTAADGDPAMELTGEYLSGGLRVDDFGAWMRAQYEASLAGGRAHRLFYARWPGWA